MSSRNTLILGALLAAAGVALGAYGAHGLEDRLVALGFTADFAAVPQTQPKSETPSNDELSQRMAWFETGVKYQLYHALGLIFVAVLAAQPTPLSTTRWVGPAFLVGILLFSGSLYAMTFLSADWRKLGAVVPMGGLSFILGWIGVAYGALHSRGT